MAEKNKEKLTQNNIAGTVIIVVAILLIAASLSVSLLNNFQDVSDKTENYSTSRIVTTVIDKMNYENLSKISKDNISKYYEIPDGTVTDSTLYISARSDNFTEIACFRLKSQDKEKMLMNVINNYITEKTNTYQNVNDKAYETVSASKIEVHYPYVFVAVASDSETAVNEFNELFNESSN